MSDRDREKYERLIREHYSRFRNFAGNLCANNPGVDADDVLQNALIKAYRGYAGFEGKSAFTTWMFRIITRVFLDARRNSKRPGRASLSLDTFAAAAEDGDALSLQVSHEHRELSTEQIYYRMTVMPELERVLGALPEPMRQAFTLYEIDGLKYEEIAALLGIPLGTAKTRLHRARRRVISELTKSLRMNPLETPSCSAA